MIRKLRAYMRMLRIRKIRKRRKKVYSKIIFKTALVLQETNWMTEPYDDEMHRKLEAHNEYLKGEVAKLEEW